MRRGRWYYGWTVIGVAFVTTGVTLGTHAAFGVLLVALVDALGWGRSVVAGAISLTAVLWTPSAAPMGAHCGGMGRTAPLSARDPATALQSTPPARIAEHGPGGKPPGPCTRSRPRAS
ncbi:MAG TPA: hypothetical protein VK066_32210 [Chloroflexota bacterium]|nr:hypothetical protein [Chloroflexota bacterium]